MLLTGYVGLSSLCILLTGSRSSLLGLLVWFTVIIWGTKYRFTALVGFAAMAPVAFVALPDSLQTRFETIINPEVGPANAKESSEGRIQGLTMGVRQWSNNPLSGIGPGAWRPANRTKIESHNLYGQLVGETGTLGLMAFLMLLGCFWMNLRLIRRIRREVPAWQNDLVFTLPSAIGVAVFLLLFMGNFGHNLFRYSWLWYGGFLIVARYCAEERLLDHEWELANQDCDEVELDDEWTAHEGHVLPGYASSVR